MTTELTFQGVKPYGNPSAAINLCKDHGTEALLLLSFFLLFFDSDWITLFWRTDSLGLAISAIPLLLSLILFSPASLDGSLAVWGSFSSMRPNNSLCFSFFLSGVLLPVELLVFFSFVASLSSMDSLFFCFF